MTFSISTKIQKIQHFSEALHVINFSSAHWVRNLLKIALPVMVFQYFRFPSTFNMAAENCTTSKTSGTQRVQNLLMVGKQFLGKVASELCRDPASQKFCQNRSISHRSRDKCFSAFYAEIQDGHQNWWENNF